MMNTPMTQDIHQPMTESQALVWVMRLMGVAVTALSLFFLSRDFVLSPAALWFFGASASVGGFTVLASLIPWREDVSSSLMS